MTSPYEPDERHLEREMLEAAQHVADVSHVEKDPLLIILWRLNHQDRTLEQIRHEQSAISGKLDDHIAREDMMKDAIDEIVAMWRGSKLAGKIVSWIVGIGAAIAAAFAAIKRGS